jgi:glycosyltransferase involved in cell wall biosynthesis
MVSVCMSVKNGAKYLEEQVMSILPQLEAMDELVVCDNGSTDGSVNILRSFRDPRIKIIKAPGVGVIESFQHALMNCTGDLIYLADQDDIWSPKKISTMSRCLEEYDVVVCDCAMIDEALQVHAKSFFKLNRSGKGFVKNLIRNSYMGCCMAFRRSVLDKALPFPRAISMHDYWIGLVAEVHFNTLFLHEPLLWHRRHATNHSTTGKRSVQPYSQRISQRFQLLRNLVQRAHV